MAGFPLKLFSNKIQDTGCCRAAGLVWELGCIQFPVFLLLSSFFSLSFFIYTFIINMLKPWFSSCLEFWTWDSQRKKSPYSNLISWRSFKHYSFRLHVRLFNLTKSKDQSGFFCETTVYNVNKVFIRLCPILFSRWAWRSCWNTPSSSLAKAGLHAARTGPPSFWSCLVPSFL